jgi:hypothetical protein
MATHLGGAAQVSTDHDFIRHWVEDRGGKPAVVKRTHGKRGPGVFRIDYPGFSGEDTLEAVDWEEFFDVFDRRKLAFLYQEKTADGKPSRFSKLVRRDSVAARSAKRKTRRMPSTSTRTAKSSTRTAKKRTTGGKSSRTTGRSARRG